MTEKSTSEKIEVRNVNAPGHVTRVDATKYTAMRDAMLRVLPDRAPGLTQAEMRKALAPLLPETLWPGGAKSGWWAKTVQLDLEARGVVEREATKPLRWHLADGRAHDAGRPETG